MRGIDHQQAGMFSYLSPEQRVRKDHPLRVVRAITDENSGFDVAAVRRHLRPVRPAMKSFQPKEQKVSAPPDDPGNPSADFHGEKRSNQTHEWKTDPQNGSANTT
jgi:hypothetical protein